MMTGVLTGPTRAMVEDPPDFTAWNDGRLVTELGMVRFEAGLAYRDLDDETRDALRTLTGALEAEILNRMRP